MSLFGGINAVCGTNGVGKSTLLRTLHCALTGTTPPGDPEVSLTGIFRGEALSGQNIGDSALLLEPSRRASELLSSLQKTANQPELFEQYEQREFSVKLLKEYGYVVGKDYQAISAVEAEGLTDSEFEPYFSVTTSQGTYGSGSMGHGELSIFLTLWALQNMPRESFVFLEEPESNLPPRAQAALINVIARYSAERSIWILLTSHSPHILEPLDDRSLTLLAAGSTDGRSRSRCLTHLGVSPFARGLFFVEDQFARSFLEQVLESAQVSLGLEFDIVSCGGDSKAVKAASGLPREQCRLTFVAILDGDSRGKEIGDSEDVNILFLPGSASPEEVLIHRVKIHADKFALALGVDIVAVKVALTAVSGTDHHDYFFGLARELSMDVRRVENAAFRCWHSNRSEDEISQTDELLDALLRLIP